jgi:serine protease Do
MMGRTRAFKLLYLCAGLLLLGAMVSTARAQDAAEEDDNYPSPERRAQLMQDLAKDVEWLERHGNVLKRVVKLVKPTVVHIEAAKTEADSFRPGRKNSVEEAGSGVIIELNRHYYVLTNRHVINDAELKAIKIKLADSRILTPTKVWSDRGTDVAVMQVDAKDLVAAQLGDSAKLDIGDFVLAVGSPFGLSHSVTSGIISAKGRRDLELGDEGVRFQDFLQTDAAINPGNSGGPLMNLRGEVVGINTAIASSGGGNEGIGFAIPINMAMYVAKQLIERGAVTRAFLGVHLDSKFTPDVAAKAGMTRVQGARISGITPNSPAAVYKLQVGDVIIRFDGQPIDDDNHLVNLVSLTPVNKDVPVILYRGGKLQSLIVRVGDRTKYEPAND